MRIVLGVAGGIAAYKVCYLLRQLKEHGHDVTVVPTAAALNFVGATTWEALSGHPVHTGVFDDAAAVPHVALGRSADLVVIAPATADLLARAAQGRADDLLTNVLLTATCPVVMAPAMHTEMWQHPATVTNVAMLRQRGVVVIDPADGRLTGADSGPGRLPEPEELFDIVQTIAESPEIAAGGRDLAGTTVVVSAGGTQEPLDPVRFIGNRSSGKMGAALAAVAALRGATVHLVAANLRVNVPSGAQVHPVSSTEDLAATMLELAPVADIIVMAAAPADFRPADVASSKIKKQGDGGLHLDLVQTTDVLATLSASRRPDQVIVGFAAETARDDEELLALGQVKLARKGCNLLVCNNVAQGAVFDTDHNDVVIIDHDAIVGRAAGAKMLVAHRILDAAIRAR